MKDGERLTRITNDELEKFSFNFSRCANLDVAPLSVGFINGYTSGEGRFPNDIKMILVLL